ILAVADGGNGTLATLETTVAVARRFGASVDVLHVSADIDTLVPVIGEGMSGAMVEQLMNAMTQSVAARAARAREAYRKACASSDVPTVWREVSGRETEIVAVAGRLTDVIVIGRPDGDGETPLAATLDAALFDTGRPVLVAPNATPAAIGSHLVLAWNGTVQAARGVAASMPFLQRAERVTVVTVGKAERDASAGDLLVYLGRHDVRATHETVEPEHLSIGKTLLKHAGRLQADMLVMGAYGHSRLREMILGGATRDVLAHATLPLLMAH
ncbi:MAG: universal stress protein, partial [Dongiaceae bacterium]